MKKIYLQKFEHIIHLPPINDLLEKLKRRVT